MKKERSADRRGMIAMRIIEKIRKMDRLSMTCLEIVDFHQDTLLHKEK